METSRSRRYIYGSDESITSNWRARASARDGFVQLAISGFLARPACLHRGGTCEMRVGYLRDAREQAAVLASCSEQ
jgi:hypothetical protein